MRELLDRRGWRRWILLALGLVLIFCSDFAAYAVLEVGIGVQLLFTIAGAIGLFALFARPPGTIQQPAKAKQTKDYWISKRRSPEGLVIPVIGGGLALAGLGLIEEYAQRLGLPAWNPGWMWWVYLFAFLLANTAVHELGHAIAAWALSHRVRLISIGPFTFSNVGYGYQFQFEWKRLLASNGYMGAVPLAGGNLRLKCIATVAGGPAASLLSGLSMLAVFLWLPGTRWQSYWWIAAFNAVLGIYYAVTSLVPVGYCDGSMLLHLILRTRAGQQLLSRFLITQIHEDAGVCHGQADFEKQVALCETALESALKGGDENALFIASCHQSLGHAKLAVEDWPGAEAEFRKCLEFEAECAFETALPANAWSGLQIACVKRHHVSEAGRAYASAVAIIEGRKKNRDRVERAVARTMMAQAHARAGNFELALKECTEALQILPGGRDCLLLRAALYSCRARSELGLSFVDSGMASARRAAEILRSGQIPPARQNLAWDQLGELAEGLWRAGQSATAVDLLREAIEPLERGGAVATATRYRIKLAAVMRQLGKLEKDGQSLPNALESEPTLVALAQAPG